MGGGAASLRASGAVPTGADGTFCGTSSGGGGRGVRGVRILRRLRMASASTRGGSERAAHRGTERCLRRSAGRLDGVTASTRRADGRGHGVDWDRAHHLGRLHVVPRGQHIGGRPRLRRRRERLGGAAALATGGPRAGRIGVDGFGASHLGRLARDVRVRVRGGVLRRRGGLRPRHRELASASAGTDRGPSPVLCVDGNRTARLGHRTSRRGSKSRRRRIQPRDRWLAPDPRSTHRADRCYRDMDRRGDDRVRRGARGWEPLGDTDSDRRRLRPADRHVAGDLKVGAVASGVDGGVEREGAHRVGLPERLCGLRPCDGFVAAAAAHPAG